MFKGCFLLGAGFCFFCASMTAVRANPISSVFDTDQGGWFVNDVFSPSESYSNSDIAGIDTSVFSAADRNPDDYSLQSSPANNDWYWYAPFKFLGNQSSAYRGAFSFDLFDTLQDNANHGESSVVLISNSLQLVHDVGLPSAIFTHQPVGLTTGGWYGDRVSGTKTKKAQIQPLLLLLALLFRGGFESSNNASGTNSIGLLPPAAVPESSLPAGMLSGTMFGAAWLFRRRNRSAMRG